MKAIKYIAIAMSLFGAVSAQAAIIPAGGFGVKSNFIDNGLITTEYRADGTVWEWLDLTVTNGISFNSLVDDLNDDKTLNNSNISTSNSSAGARADVAALSAAHTTGWNTVSALDVVEMFNSFFGTTLVVGATLRAPSDPLDDDAVVEKFIQLFGDTYHEGRSDTGSNSRDANDNLDNIGYAQGATATALASPAAYNFATVVYDGQYINLNDDSNDDFVALDFNANRFAWHENVGTWLLREVKSVSEPATAVMFTLGLMGVIVRRRRN